jgi:imidazolonepropionase-like amidohydrolase
MDYRRHMRLAITNALVFDGAQLSEGTIHIADGLIAAVGDEASSAGAEVIDARGGTVTPGLIDAHFHAYATDLDVLAIHAAPLSYVALAAGRRLEAALRRGFTTVRDVAGGDPGLVRAIEQGLVRAPRYLYTGPALSQTGGHGDPRPGDIELCACGGAHMSEVVDGVDAVRRAARDRFRRGAHAIKIMTSGGVVSPTDPIRRPQYSAEELRAVVDEAERRGSYVAAHAYSPEAIAHSVENGIRSIEHGNLIDAPTAELMARHGAYLVPTLAAYDALDQRGAQLGLSAVSQAKNREVLDAGQRAVELARAAGVPIGWGSDLMGALEDHQLQGLRLQAEVEGALETLRSATTVNAALLGREDIGRIAVGAAADLVIFGGNPLDRPELLWAPDGRRVIAGGRPVSRGRTGA